MKKGNDVQRNYKWRKVVSKRNTLMCSTERGCMWLK